MPILLFTTPVPSRENANLRVYGRLGQQQVQKEKSGHDYFPLCGCMMQEPLVVEKLKKATISST